MKTPREILLERHRHIEPKLDRIRAWVLSGRLPRAIPAAPQAPEGPGSPLACFLRSAWLELFWRPRRIWAGFAGVWLAVIAANSIDARQARIAALKSTSVPPQVLLAWKHQLFADLDSQPQTSGKPRSVPRPGAQQREPHSFG